MRQRWQWTAFASLYKSHSLAVCVPKKAVLEPTDLTTIVKINCANSNECNSMATHIVNVFTIEPRYRYSFWIENRFHFC